MDPKKIIIAGGALAAGAGSTLVLDRLLRSRLPERGRPLAVGGVLGASGATASYVRSDIYGAAFALGAVGAAAVSVLRPSSGASSGRALTEGRAARVKDDSSRDAEYVAQESEEIEVPVDSSYAGRIQEAVDRAHAEWSRNVTEPTLGGDWRRINEYIKGPEGLERTDVRDYTRDLDFAWCGAFVAYAWGPQVRSDIRKKMGACSSMFYAWKDTPRFVANKIPQPGDIVTLHPVDDRSHAPGTHILLAATPPDAQGNFETYEGNTIGPGPNGVKVDGVARRVRNVGRIANVYRLLPEDFVEFTNA
jgi:hypothetical protein